jgi:putative MATE family efflux protein
MQGRDGCPPLHFLERRNDTMLREKTERLGSAPLGSLLIRLSIPGILAMLVIAFHNFIDTFWVAKINPRAIAAITIVFPYQILVGAVGSGTGAGIGAFSSKCFGRRDAHAANLAAGQVIFLALFFGILFTAVTLQFPGPLLQLFGVTAEIYDDAFSYLTTIAFGASLVFFSIMSDSLFRGAGDTFTPMCFMITSAVLNMILDPLLIFGPGPFPAMGVRGAALATVIAQSVAALMGLAFLFSRRSGYHVRASALRPDLPVIREIYRVGLPSFVMQITFSVVMIALNNMTGRFGSDAIASLGLLFRIGGFIIMPLFGMTLGLLPIVGFNFGAGNWPRLWKAVKLAGLGSFIFGGTAFIFAQLFTSFWVGLFTRDPELMRVAVPAIRLSLLMVFLVGPQIMWSTTFQGLGKGTTAMVLSLTRQCIFLIPVLLILPGFMGVRGIWLSFPISDAAAFCISTYWLYREYRRRCMGPHQ